MSFDCAAFKRKERAGDNRLGPRYPAAAVADDLAPHAVAEGFRPGSHVLVATARPL